MQDIFKYIEDHLNESIASLNGLCKLPTVSAQKQAIGETADHVVGMLRPLGFETQVLPKSGGPPSAQPVVFAELRGQSPRTLLFYNHYDVQPPEPLELWESPPFALTQRDGALFARGSKDDKGEFMARLAALDAVHAVDGGYPCRIKFLVEGEEEVGSPHLPEWVARHADRLKVDGAVWEEGGIDADGH